MTNFKMFKSMLFFTVVTAASGVAVFSDRVEPKSPATEVSQAPAIDRARVPGVQRRCLLSRLGYAGVVMALMSTVLLPERTMADAVSEHKVVTADGIGAVESVNKTITADGTIESVNKTITADGVVDAGGGRLSPAECYQTLMSDSRMEISEEEKYKRRAHLKAALKGFELFDDVAISVIYEHAMSKEFCWDCRTIRNNFPTATFLPTVTVITNDCVTSSIIVFRPHTDTTILFLK